MALVYWPKHPPERLSYIFVIGLMMVIIITQFVYYFPNVILSPTVTRGFVTGHKTHEEQIITIDSTSIFYPYSLFHLVLTIYLILNLIGNLIQMVRTDSSTAGCVLPNILKPGWKYCSDCLENAPERSLHCYFCNRCILRQELHCFFTGTCVGLRNMRYYICLLLYTVLTTAYFTYINLPHLMERIHQDLSPKDITSYQVTTDGEPMQIRNAEPSGVYLVGMTVLALAFPLLGVTFGALRIGTAFLSLLNGITLIGGLMLTALFISHVFLLFRNQTSYESRHRINTYRLRGVGENLSQALGSRWYLVWLSPLAWLPFSRLPTDGGITIPYPTASRHIPGTPKDE